MAYAASYVVLAMSMGLLVTDFARMQSVSAQLGDAAESAARYAATGLVDATYSNKAQAVASQYVVNGTTLSIDGADVQPGLWNPSTATFTANSTTPNAIKIITRQQVSTVFGASSGSVSRNLSSSAVAYFNKNIMLVVGNLTLSASDTAMYNRLRNLGYNVVVTKDSDATQALAEENRLVVISETSTSSLISTRLRYANVPVLCYEPILYDDMGMTGVTEFTDFGCSTVGNAVSIVTPSHPIAAGYSGTVNVTTLPASMTGAGLAWGAPAASATIIANVQGYTSQKAIFAYAAGATMKNSVTAPAIRVGLWGCSPNTAGQGGVPTTAWSTQGWNIFDAAVNWAIGTTPPIRTVRLGK